MSNTPGLDATTGETWWRETAGLWLERARIAERERDDTRALAERYREALEWYATAANWENDWGSVDPNRCAVTADQGERARSALLVEHDSSSETTTGAAVDASNAVSFVVHKDDGRTITYEVSLPRNGALMDCGCWCNVTAGSTVGETRERCPTHHVLARMVKANVDEPDGIRVGNVWTVPVGDGS